MKKVELKLNGKPIVLGGPGPKAMRVITFIRSIAHDEFYDVEGISDRLKVGREAAGDIARKCPEEIEGYFIIVPGFEGSGKKLLFGSKNSIKKLRAQLEIDL